MILRVLCDSVVNILDRWLVFDLNDLLGLVDGKNNNLAEVTALGGGDYFAADELENSKEGGDELALAIDFLS